MRNHIYNIIIITFTTVAEFELYLGSTMWLRVQLTIRNPLWIYCQYYQLLRTIR